MSDYINDALLQTNNHKKLKEESKHLVDKWDKTGLLDGLDGDYDRSGMAIILENQAKQLIDEASKTGTASDSEQWSGVALPLVRRIFAEIAAQDFVSVQPMNLPSGLVFYLDFKYGSNDSSLGAVNNQSLFGKSGPNTPSGAAAPYGEQGLYGTGRYGYSIKTGSDAVSFTWPAGSAVNATWKDVNFDTQLSSSANAGNLWKITGTMTSGVNADVKSVRAWNFDDASAGSSVVLPEFSSATDVAAPVVTLIVSQSTVADATGSYNIGYHKQPTDSTRGDMEDSVTEPTATSIPIPEVNLELKSKTIVAKTRKLKAVWTPELAQDLNAYHSVDAEAELTSMLSEYISMEIDLEILDMLISDATTTDYWSTKVGEEYDGVSDFQVNTAGLAYTKFDWYQTLGQKIQKVSNEIHKLTLRGGANFIVCGPTVATIIESIPGFGAATDGNKASFAMGVNQVGTLQNRWTVYKNPYMSENTILVGFRGSNFLETGAVYAPYVPLIMTPLVYDPVNFTPRKGVMTRYAKKMVRPEFYGKIHVKGLELV